MGPSAHPANKYQISFVQELPVYPVQLTDEDYVDFHHQNFMQNGIYKNHFFNYEDTHAKHRTHRDGISTGLAPLRCVFGPRTWHKTDESTIDLEKKRD